MHDLTQADTLGFNLLLENLKNGSFDTYFIHLVGMDHAGHNGGMNNQARYDEAVDSIDEKLNSLFSYAEASDERINVLVFGDHGTSAEGNHGNTDTVRAGSTVFFTYSNREEFLFP